MSGTRDRDSITFVGPNPTGTGPSVGSQVIAVAVERLASCATREMYDELDNARVAIVKMEHRVIQLEHAQTALLAELSRVKELRIEELKEQLKAKEESQKHWLRYVIATTVTILIAALSLYLGATLGRK